jgi:hypothetical protein
MKKFVPIPPESLKHLQEGQETELSYRFVAVRLKDGRHFEPVVESEGHIIQVKNYESIPFTEDDVELVEASSKRWNFRRRTRPREA